MHTIISILMLFTLARKSKYLHGDCLGQLIAHYSKHNELIGFIFAG